MEIKQISLIEPRSKDMSLWSLVKQPRLGLVILATILKSQGYKVKVLPSSLLTDAKLLPDQ